MKKSFSPSPSKNSLIIYGRHAVLAALANKKRTFTKLLCTKENAALLPEKAPVSPQIAEKKEIDALVGAETAHQGFALFCSRLPTFSLEEIISKTKNKKKCHILILDQVTDPQNIGAIIRSAVAFNTEALIVQDKNSPLESGAMDKAAAGMIEHLPIVRVSNISRAIDALKKEGFWTIGMDGYAETTLDKIDTNEKLAVIMGSEGKGMRRLIEESCDTLVRLPISPLTESLNVATAAAITLYEINKGQ